MRWTIIVLFLSILTTVAVVGAADDVDMDDADIDMMGEDANVEVDEAVEAPPAPKEKIEYKTPSPDGNAFFFETFDDEKRFSQNWVLSKAKKDGADAATSKYDGKWSVQEASDGVLIGDLGLVLGSPAKHHAIAAMLKKPYHFKGNPFVMQYDVRFTNGQNCGGAYVKLLSNDPGLSLKQLHDKTPYTIMFGPDKCGTDNKLHFIFRHKNPVTGEFEEKHAKKPSASLDYLFSDKKTHLLTLVINSDNTFQVYLDQKVINSGSLLSDFEPAVNPAKEVVDTNEKKPDDWDDSEKIADPDAKKPEDWDESAPKEIPDEFAVKPDGWLDDEPELVPDPEAVRPADWDDEMDGEWEAPQVNNAKCSEAPGCGEWKVPLIANPSYKGKWTPSMIDNPDYKGKWSPRMIPNPKYFEDNEPWRMTPIGAVGLELWSMSDGIVFDNFIITDDKKVADDLAKATWGLKSQSEGRSSGKSVVDFLLEAAEDRPWMWLVYVAVIVLPLIGFYQLIKPRPIKNSAADTKKTDAETKKTDAETKKKKVPTATLR